MYRPTQDEVEAKAAEMFGEGWKALYESQKSWADARIAERLDAARAAVMAEHS